MEKMKMQTPDLADENFQKLAVLFPNAVTETKDENGNIVRSIDVDVLRQEINTSVVEGSEERYRFTWPEKREAIRLAATPIAASLRPCQGESVNFDKTENVYIEGDNLDVLKLLRETYLGKVKMIYIDPPYNTGNDFVYEDDFSETKTDYLSRSGQLDNGGNRLVRNTETNGRFHTDWLNMIYPRLRVAKDLLADNGVIFISIDDNEQGNLKKVCDDVFGEENFVATIVWQKKYAATNDSKWFSTTHDYIIIYAKSLQNFNRNLLPRTKEQNAPYKHDDGDGKGLWRSDNLLVKSFSASCVYPIVNPNTGIEYYPPSGSCWRANRETMKSWLSENRIYFGKDGKGAPQLKRYLSEVQQGRVPITWWSFEDVGHNDAANKEIRLLFGSKPPFDTPKPVSLVRQMLLIASDKNSLVMDFFSGSATSAHATMQLNAEDGGSRKFIMVQIPEICSEESDAFKTGYKNICEIGKERIRRAGKRIKDDLIAEIKKLKIDIEKQITETKKQEDSLLVLEEETKLAQLRKCHDEKQHILATLDTGFRVFKLDSSNMKDVYYNPGKTEQKDLLGHVDNIKEDRTPEDLLFQVMLEFGIPLSSKIRKIAIAGKDVFNVEDNFLIACFDDDITNEIITAIAKEKPQYVVLRDSGFKTDSVAANFEQIFATYSPDTTRRIL